MENMNDSVPCINIHTVDSSQQCDFFLNTTRCHNSDGKLDYMYFIFCYFQQQSGIGVFLCVLWLMLLFVALGVTADDFLCPSLVVITKTLHLSQNIAGVTFLAFGNGAPDIFSSVAGIEQDRPELVIGTLFGAGIFVTSVVAGSIVASKPFKIMERPFLRDLVFYLGASFWAFLRFYYGGVTLWHSIGFVILYIVYILVVIISRIIYNKYRKKPEKPDQSTTIPTIEIITPIENGNLPHVTFQPNPDLEDNPEAEGVVLRRFSFRGSIPGARKRHSSCHAHHEHVLKALTQSVEHRPDPTLKSSIEKQHRLESQESKTSLSSLLSKVSDGGFGERLKEFFLHICPIDIEIWPERKWYYRILDIIKAPVCLLLVLTVPVVDYENDNNNWCRLLNSLHCITSPMFILLVTGNHDFKIGGMVPLWAVILIISFMISVIIFLTSSADEPPLYHGAFGYAGFAASVIWVYLVASEIVSLLKAIGIVFKLSDAILGLTVLAWGNSIGDFISNLSVAKQGYPRMGISACYGGPLLNLLLGIGIPYTVAIVKTGTNITLHLNKLICLLYGTLTFVLISTIVTMTIMKFNAKRYFGVFLLCCYGIFLVIAILLESHII